MRCSVSTRAGVASWRLGLIAAALMMAWTAQAAEVDRFTLTTPFPKDFLFGTSLAGFQVEMGCPSLPAAQCEDRSSDWYAYTTSPWTVNDPLLHLTGEPPSAGPGFFETYREDLRRSKDELASNAVRISIEWSRLFPEATFGIDGYEQLRQHASAEGLAYYHKLISDIRAKGMEPFVTVNHYTLPLWIHDAVGCHLSLLLCYPKGWADPAMIVPEIAKYAGFVAQEFGHEVDYWATLNGPFASVVFSGFLFPNELRSNPPAVFLDVFAAKTAMRAMVEAHARMYDAIRAADVWSAVPGRAPAAIGLVGSNFAAHPASAKPGDVQAAKNLRYLINDLFLNAVAKGDLDENWDGHAVHREDLSNRLDWIGLNYYTSVKVAEAPVKFLQFVSPLFTFDPLSGFDAFAPQDLYQVIAQASEYGKPVYVTETGYDAAVDPVLAHNWLVRSLDAVRRATLDGYPVKGYFLWSLIDNYEWNRGTKPRFGLYEVDPQDPLRQRHARAAVATFKQFGAAKLFPEVTN